MTKLQYYKNLDGLRAIAALMVVVFHFMVFTPYINNPDFALIAKISEFGQHGVSLFFVLSGFVITRILFRDKNTSGYFKNFYIRRSLRIFPLYYAYLLIMVWPIPQLLFSQETHTYWPFFVYLQNMTYTNGPGHLWSLAVEEHFYLIWPLLIYLVPIRKTPILVFIITIIMLVIRYLVLNNSISLNINFSTFTRIDQLSIGALLAWIEYKNIGWFKKLKPIFFLTAGILSFSVLIYLYQESIFITKSILRHSLLGAFFFLVIGILVFNQNLKINSILRHPILQYLGKISYGIYVWHTTAINIVKSELITNYYIVDLLVTIAISTILASISYYLIEKYFLTWKDKLTR